MHIITLGAKEHYEYLMFVFHKHVKGGGMEPEELEIAGRVWKDLRGAQEFDPASLETGEDKEVIQIPGPVSVVHNGDLTVPISGDPSESM
jgi:hypothetical protein